ncbi:unnamed protein product [Plutella xylostella]|uniref:UBX domain-containing protein 4 n=1 Tax=Plutella xylostella TaxID=51655 RepID=A0A8S4G5L2_PLUXY|nr:unnamed protein product [Plutella xylostella]
MVRQRVLDQIAQDRAERRARDLPPAPAPAPATPVTPTAPLDLGNKARIQFKMPDGSSATAQFDAGDTLATVRRHVADNLHMPDGSSAAAQFDAGDTLATVRRHVADNLHLTSSSFTLWTAFPRLELRDDSATLTQLKLAPSAALLVLPSSAVAKPNTSSRIASFTTFLIQILTSLVIEPTTLVYNWVRARLFPPPPANPRRPTPPPATSAPGLRYRHRTNVHRLNGDADDDENNTWNGNSTQQM